MFPFTDFPDSLCGWNWRPLIDDQNKRVLISSKLCKTVASHRQWEWMLAKTKNKKSYMHSPCRTFPDCWLFFSEHPSFQIIGTVTILFRQAGHWLRWRINNQYLHIVLILYALYLTRRAWRVLSEKRKGLSLILLYFCQTVNIQTISAWRCWGAHWVTKGHSFSTWYSIIFSCWFGRRKACVILVFRI